MTSVPGLRYLPGWLGDEAELLARIDVAPWSSELSRRVQHYGHRYDYGRRSVAGRAPAPPLPGWAVELAERLHREGVMASPADQVIVNEYLPGQGISAHVDCVPCFWSGCRRDQSRIRLHHGLHQLEDGVKVPVRLEPGLGSVSGPDNAPSPAAPAGDGSRPLACPWIHQHRAR